MKELKQAIERLIYTHIQIDCYGEERPHELDAGTAAAAIAELLDRELAEKQETIENYAYNLDQFRMENDKLKVRLAEMQHALEVYADEDKWKDFNPSCWEKVRNVFYRCDKHGYEEAQKALAAGEGEDAEEQMASE